jgi:sporulation protein YlmC with PRC-barrel domain
MILSSSSLSGNPVKNKQGENLGKIEDFMIDTNTGEVVYSVLSFGGVMGVGDKLFAVPVQAMQLDTEEHAFILNESKERLKNAPGFDKDHWPNTADSKWHDSVRTYYRV